MNRVFEQSVLHWEREIPQIRSGESDGRRYVMSESLQFHWPGRGSGGSMSATRPFGQPLVLLSRQESPSTSSSPRPMERFYRATNKKRWQRWNILQLEGGGKKVETKLESRKSHVVLFIIEATFRVGTQRRGNVLKVESESRNRDVIGIKGW